MFSKAVRVSSEQSYIVHNFWTRILIFIRLLLVVDVCPCVCFQGEFVSCLLALLKQMGDQHYQHHLQRFTSKDELRVREAQKAMFYINKRLYTTY